MRNNFFWGWLMIALTLISCSPLGTGGEFVYVKSPVMGVMKRRIPIWIDKNFGQADRVEIQSAIDQWQFALNGYVDIQIESVSFDMQEDAIRWALRSDGWIIMKIDSGNPIVLDKPGRKTLAFTDKIGGNYLYLIRDRVEEGMIRGIMMHEIGHLLGAADNNDGNLMDGKFSLANERCIDLETVKEVARYQELEVGQLNYCVYPSDKR
jgi:hypothetical protein